MIRLQGYFEIPPDWAISIPHGMIKFRVEIDNDPGMGLDMVGSGKVLKTLDNGNLLVIGAYNTEQLAALDGMIPECFICRSHEELMVLRPELAGIEVVNNKNKLIIPKCRFAQ